MNIFKTCYESELGVIEIAATQDGVLSVDFSDSPINISAEHIAHQCLEEPVRQLNEYFTGRRKEFSIRLLPQGTLFQEEVWRCLALIPFGDVWSYKKVARLAGSEKAARAVGHANMKNKIAIFIPCHRVIGSDGKLYGYSKGIWRKRWLLEHEKRVAKKKAQHLNI